jgi:hypothetical protein
MRRASQLLSDIDGQTCEQTPSNGLQRQKKLKPLKPFQEENYDTSDESSPINSTFSLFQRRKAQAEPKKKTRDIRNLGIHLCIATKQKGANTKEMQLQITQFAELKQQNRRKPLRHEVTCLYG